MTPRHRVWVALQSGRPAAALESLAVALRDEGTSQAALYRLFSRAWMAQTSEEKQDLLVEVMDRIWGGVYAKGRALYPTELTAERLRDEK